MTRTSALVVVSHPDPGSFNHALAHSVMEAFRALGRFSTLVDLHAIGFDPVLSIPESHGRATTDTSVQRQIRLLSDCDVLVAIHPNCWGGPPAMMKGWIDRVFAPNAAYSFAKGDDDGGVPVGLLKGKRALILNTSNTELERELGVFGDPLERMWRDCLLAYCGIEHAHREVFRVVATSTEEQRAEWLHRAAALAHALVRGE